MMRWEAYTVVVAAKVIVKQEIYLLMNTLKEWKEVRSRTSHQRNAARQKMELICSPCSISTTIAKFHTRLACIALSPGADNLQDLVKQFVCKCFCTIVLCSSSSCGVLCSSLAKEAPVHIQNDPPPAKFHDVGGSNSEVCVCSCSQHSTAGAKGKWADLGRKKRGRAIRQFRITRI